MHLIAIAAAVIAALIHVYFFVLESLWFMRPAVWGRFGLDSAEDAEITRSFAYNQGFYNLFLAVGAAIGIAFVSDQEDVGVALIVFGTGSMLAAALVLVTSDLSKARAAVVQGLLPGLALLALLVHALG